MKTLRQEEIVRIAQSATESVFSTMLHVPALPQPTRTEAGDPAPIAHGMGRCGVLYPTENPTECSGPPHLLGPWGSAGRGAV